ncbi:phosphatase PAP2 family protein [Actinocrispum wychmicini]|uniref:Undecaprenyl-diphosphatase n=1 Tax=Actinocrispum wychmicini TaxID=1213861 RepID=A0A4R2IRV0_9PSEU|nr:phosphatase PAP2 family protein [Actinocrispum wychmicini]TCO48033.1 undecaprenyl-diphosphatase [Actinocrispum wychmicini]
MKKAGIWGAALVAVFLLLGLWVRDSVPWIDTQISDAIGTTYVNDRTVQVLTDILGPIVPIVAAVALAGLVVLMWIQDRNWEAGVVLRCLVVLLACRGLSLFKDVFKRLRPRLYPEFAYPSGHTVSVACVGFTAVLLCAWFARRALPWVIALAAALTAGAAACRVMLGVHWLTDVIGAVIGVTGVGLIFALVLRLVPVRRA